MIKLFSTFYTQVQQCDDELDIGQNKECTNKTTLTLKILLAPYRNSAVYAMLKNPFGKKLHTLC